MFGTKKTSADSAIKNHIIPTTNSKALNTIVNSTSIEGNIKSENDIRIDGNLVGDLTCGAKVIIGPQGKVNGQINCVNAVVEGKFDGILIVKELLTLASTAVVKGDIKTNKWIVQSGAIFNGECKMGNATIPLSSVNKTEKTKIVKRKEAIAK